MHDIFFFSVTFVSVHTIIYIGRNMLKFLNSSNSTMYVYEKDEGQESVGLLQRLSDQRGLTMCINNSI